MHEMYGLIAICGAVAALVAVVWHAGMDALADWLRTRRRGFSVDNRTRLQWANRKMVNLALVWFAFVFGLWLGGHIGYGNGLEASHEAIENLDKAYEFGMMVYGPCYGPPMHQNETLCYALMNGET